MIILGFYPPHEIWKLARHARCARCGMLFDEIVQYRVLLCPAGYIARTKRAHRQFSIKGGVCQGFLSYPMPEKVVYQCAYTS